MGWWDALSDTMRTWRTGRIGLPEADRLVSGEPVTPEHNGLSTLLSAAAAPPFVEELADERAAVTGFTRARPGAVATTMPVGRRRAWIPRSTGTIAVKVAAGVAVLVTGGTAFAAATGSLPAGLQQHAQDLFSPLGVPAPGADARASGAATGGVASSGPPSGGPTAGAGDRSPVPADAGALGLCQAWEAAQKNPHGKAMTPELRRALTAAADGESGIPGFCAKVLADHPVGVSPGTVPAPHPGQATPAPGHVGGGNPSSKGKEHSRTAPSPHHQR
jgi:hypothetical protein